MQSPSRYSGRPDRAKYPVGRPDHQPVRKSAVVRQRPLPWMPSGYHTDGRACALVDGRRDSSVRYTMIRALLVDLDGVLRIWNPDINARVESATGLPNGAILRAAFSPELLTPAVTGLVSDSHWRSQVIGRLHADYPEADAAQAVGIWSAHPGEVDADMLQLIRSSRRRSRVVLVTNATSRLSLDLGRLGLSDEFDSVINSSEIGACKPQREIYDAALRAAGVQAEEALFIDDNPRLVDAAQRLGIVAHLYRGSKMLSHEMVRLGLPVA